jgi:hypothetical protein
MYDAWRLSVHHCTKKKGNRCMFCCEVQIVLTNVYFRCNPFSRVNLFRTFLDNFVTDILPSVTFRVPWSRERSKPMAIDVLRRILWIVRMVWDEGWRLYVSVPTLWPQTWMRTRILNCSSIDLSLHVMDIVTSYLFRNFFQHQLGSYRMSVLTKYKSDRVTSNVVNSWCVTSSCILLHRTDLSDCLLMSLKTVACTIPWRLHFARDVVHPWLSLANILFCFWFFWNLPCFRRKRETIRSEGRRFPIFLIVFLTFWERKCQAVNRTVVVCQPNLSSEFDINYTSHASEQPGFFLLCCLLWSQITGANLFLLPDACLQAVTYKRSEISWPDNATNISGFSGPEVIERE